MPYIDRAKRGPYQELISELAKRIPQEQIARPGHMNYVISLLIDRVYGGEMRYSDHNEVMGVLSSVSQEFYRRKTAPYEEAKMREQGDLTDL